VPAFAGFTLVKDAASTTWNKTNPQMERVMLAARRPIQPGEVFERLTVIGQADPKLMKNGRHKIYRVSCRCSCGNEAVVYESKLRYGSTRSCGCLERESSINNLPPATHGKTRRGQPRSRTYSCWLAMKARCTNPNTESYPLYGGRGISICERWKKFENFLADMGEMPLDLTLDRVRSEGNYEPGNCRWADWDTQENNRRNNRRVVIKGVNLTVAQASRQLGISQSTIGHRAKRLEVSYQEATNFYAVQQSGN
jgi:hypothetical protein